MASDFAAAHALASDGARVALVGRDATRAADAAQSISETGGEAIGLAGDLCVDGDAERVLAAAQHELGPVRGVAVTTGLGMRGQRALLAAADDDWQHTFDDVLLATVRACRAAVPLLVDGGRWCDRHDRGLFGAGAEAAPGAVRVAQGRGGDDDQGAREVVRPAGRARQLRLPGATETEILASMRVALARDRGWPEDEALERAMVEDWGMHVALGRAGKPAEVGDVIAFLLSERASYVNGALVNVDGGTDF